MEKQPFYRTAGKPREYSFFFDIQSLIGRNLFNSKPSIKNGYCNLGCGPRYIDGYVNADFFTFNFLRKILNKVQYKLDWEIDLRYKLNCRSDHFDGILLEHVLEHLNIQDAIKLIKELYRVLKPGGVLRISVPSLEIYANYYLNSIIPSKKFEMWNGCKAESMWNIAYNYGHNCFYDFELMSQVIKDGNFKKINKSSYNQSKDTMLNIDDSGHRWESLYVEAVK